MIKHERIERIASRHKSGHDGYEYNKRIFLSRDSARQCTVSVYEIPPKKAAYPYHSHTQNEEVFYIISGEGTLKTPDGERRVGAGELLYFSADADGAHKLTNASETEPLIYVDFDTVNAVDVAIYPDSNKIGIWGKGVNKVFRADDAVDYYEGE